jgi:hypothetical protein
MKMSKEDFEVSILRAPVATTTSPQALSTLTPPLSSTQSRLCGKQQSR